MRRGTGRQTPPPNGMSNHPQHHQMPSRPSPSASAPKKKKEDDMAIDVDTSIDVERQYNFKFILVGDSNVGKSCLLMQFTEGRFNPNRDITIGVEFGSKVIQFPLHQQLHPQPIVCAAGTGTGTSSSRASSKFSSAPRRLTTIDPSHLRQPNKSTNTPSMSVTPSESLSFAAAAATSQTSAFRAMYGNVSPAMIQGMRLKSKGNNNNNNNSSSSVRYLNGGGGAGGAHVPDWDIPRSESVTSTPATTPSQTVLQENRTYDDAAANGVKAGAMEWEQQQQLQQLQEEEQQEEGEVNVEISDLVRARVQVWDTAGQEAFRSITRSYYRGACGALLVFDATKYESFVNCRQWLEDVLSYSSMHMTIMVVANKADLLFEEAAKKSKGEEKEDVGEQQNEQPAVGESEGEDALYERVFKLFEQLYADVEKFAAQHDVLFCFASARRGTNVDYAFHALAQRVALKIEDGTVDAYTLTGRKVDASSPTYGPSSASSPQNSTKRNTPPPNGSERRRSTPPPTLAGNSPFPLATAPPASSNGSTTQTASMDANGRQHHHRNRHHRDAYSNNNNNNNSSNSTYAFHSNGASQPVRLGEPRMTTNYTDLERRETCSC